MEERAHSTFVRCSAALVILTLAAGSALYLSFLAALVSFGPVFRILWVLHVLLQLAAVGASLALVGIWARALGRVSALYVASAAILFGGALVQGLLPIVSRDALIYHLAVPKLWLAAGSIVEIGWHEWSHFPLLLSVGYAGFLDFGLERFAAWYHGGFLLLVGAAAAAFVYYKYVQPELALFTWTVTLTVPVVMKVASEPMADLAAATYFGLAVLLFFVWGEQRGKTYLLAAVGGSLGLACSMKYNSLLGAVLWALAAGLFLARWGYSTRRIVTAIGVVAGVAFLVWLPWPLKNAVHTGNPVYPFLGGVFGGAGGTPFVGELSPIAYRMQGYGEGPFDWLLLPVRMLVSGVDGNPRAFDGIGSPVLLIALAAFLARGHDGKRPAWLIAAAIAWVGYIYSSIALFHALIRYQILFAAVGATLVAAGADAIVIKAGEDKRARILRGLAAFHLLLAAWYLSGVLMRSQALWYFSHGETDEEYLSRNLSELRAVKLVRAHIPRDAVVYLLYTGNRYYYYDREVRGRYFSHEPIVTALRRRNAPEEIVTELASLGVTHLAIHNRLLRKALEEALSDGERTTWTRFVKEKLSLVAEDEGISLWKLEGRDPAVSRSEPSA